MDNLKSSSVGDWAELISDAACRYLSPPVLWCPASRCWVDGKAPYAPLDPALWRVHMSSFLNTLEMHADGPGEFGIAEEGKEPVPSRRKFPTWTRMAREVRYASGPVTRDLKEVLSGESAFRRESAITPERWLSLCDQSAAAFVSRRDLIAAFRHDCPHAVTGERAFLTLARQLFGRDGRFGPLGARGPWGFRVTLPR